MIDHSQNNSSECSKADNLLESLFRAAAMSSRQSIKPRSEGGPAPLSASQQQMWFLNQLNPDSPVYNTFRAFYLNGQLDLKVFEDCIKEIVRRHETLRTVFQFEDGVPVQVVRPDMGFDFSFKDLSCIDELHGPSIDNPDSAKKKKLNELLVAEAQRTFDLMQGPCLRVFIFKLGENGYCFQLVMHHIYCDGWSLSTFFRELAALYEAFLQGRDSPLEELPVQYSDYAVWQQKWLKSDDVQIHFNYWKERLKGSHGGLNLPFDYPRPSVQSFMGGLEDVIISRQLTDRLKTFSSHEGVTLFMTLLAAYQVLLYRYSGQTDIVTGSPIANRNHPETHDMIGCFVNTLALRSDLSGSPNFRELVNRIKKTTIDAYAHQDLPFQVLVQEIHSSRDMTFTPLFQTSFVLQNTPHPVLEFSGLTLKPLRVDNMTAKYDLNLMLREYDGELKGKLEYSTDLFKADTISRLISHFYVLLAGVLENPDIPVSESPLLTENEKNQLLLEWHNAGVYYPKDKCVHELFQERAERDPDAVALIFGNDRFTYGELNSRANQLSHYLRKLGVGPESLAGICLERSLEMVIGILGILKAGAAYVPLDPAYPKERLEFIIEDTHASVVVTQENLLDILPKHTSNIVCIDTEQDNISQCESHNSAGGVTPDNAAYIIYTSGSTGKPKGVVIEHCNVVRLFEGAQSLYHFNRDDVWTLFHSFAFDFSVWELWGALIYGGTLVIVPYRVSRSLDEFYELLIEKQVTILNITPSVFRELIQTDLNSSARDRLSLRYIIFGGEELKTADLQPWYENHDDQYPRLVNMYGITETTVHVTYRALTATDATGSKGRGIGRPLPDLRIYLLDSNMQPVPIGVPGEICVGGAGLAREYLNRPELTEEKFIPDAFSGQAGARMYKSGDLGRYLPDGTIEFIGRKDNQVKVRGYRIELGEIESVIVQHPEVTGALVIARDDRGGDTLLASYVLVRDTSKDITDELRKMLKQKLPDYMVPSVIVLMEAFPLTPNGKIDRDALPAPFARHTEQGNKPVPPQSPFEEKLATIWQAIFERNDIGIHDDFFELGGHSLLAMRLIAWVRRDLHVELPIHSIFESPTIAGLAKIAERMS